MCGIVGIINQNDKHIKENVDNMLNIIYKRGPDGEGHYSQEGIELAMRRLSIIDIEGGQQPFFSGSEKKVVAFQNGEIYNYKELQKELETLDYTFISHSDTEVIAHGYDAWSVDGLAKKLDGMFAIAIYDKQKNKLFLIRDRFGEKPLYYSFDKELKAFGYASDLRALLHLDWVDPSYSKTALSRYLMLGFTTGKDSIVESIKKVLPAHYLSLDLDDFSIEEKCYYVPNTFEHKYEDKTKELHSKLEESIDLRLRSDVPVGVFLSGGIDSSIIAAMSAKKHEKIDTFSMGFHSDKHDESKYAKEVAKYVGSNHHHFMFDEDKFVELLPTVVAELDEPLADQATLPTYWLAKEAKKFVTVVLSGEGGDEVFGGYSYYKQFENGNELSSLVDNAQGVTPSGFPLLMSVQSCKMFMKQDFSTSTKYEEQLLDFFNISESGIKKAMYADLMTWLPDNLLVKLDRMAMANSLEGRVPFLSHKVVDFSFSLQEKDWICEDEYKVMLRNVGKKYLPNSIFTREKQGFVLPMDEWIKRWFEKESVKSFFSSRDIEELNTKKIIQWVEEQLKQPSFNQRLIFAFIMLYEWHQINMKEIKK